MTWLGGWLRELILVVLMAAFVEMLLPGKSMERYARLVLSLLVLLTMLSPIISLLKGDAAAELKLALVQQDQNGGLLGGAGQGAGSLEKILADGRMLAAGAREQSLQLAAEEVAGQMREQIAASTGVQGVKVTVKLGVGKVPGTGGSEEVPVISAVNVILQDPDAAADSSVDAGIPSSADPPAEPIVIQPVEPVQVRLGAGNAGTEKREDSSPASAGSGNGLEDKAAAAEAQSVIRLLEQNWNLDPDVIQVQNAGSGTVKS
ncbi:stage III sporulation protein AF [Paenibacillus sp. PK3_47]|uniref:stage III sporulation protein AF n=1 Tax=Paenibacillus sp. PK3_47 TaxID=2072642 RepID=UPI00201D41D1|nr:stage III sporulation protein AF [Paenibacillus sp. PK3_47]UQZ32546.1 stage III sporulation protein AF [Paenibacillus sp. PK3_47]